MIQRRKTLRSDDHLGAPGLHAGHFASGALLCVLSFACDGSVLEVGAFRASGGVSAASGVAGSGAAGLGGGIVVGGTEAQGGSGGMPACVETRCQSRLYLCGNCEDDDQDGLIDARDPDCLGACDDSEATLDVALPGGTSNRLSSDCYFDHDSGKGNDGCEWDRCCDPLWADQSECAGAVPDNCSTQESQSSSCQSACLPWVPNGCDCFGCCTIGQHTVFVGTAPGGQSSCTLEVLGDPTRCAPCTPNQSCNNPCETCELCVGKNRLPAACGAVLPQCPSGFMACGADSGVCSPNYYCLTGCCVSVPQ